MSTTREKDRQVAFAVHKSLQYAEVFADGCAHRDKQVIAYLRKRIAASLYPDELSSALNDIENGVHVS